MNEDAQKKVMVSVETLKHCQELLATLTKNAPHCFGIDFAKLNDCQIELATRIKESGK